MSPKQRNRRILPFHNCRRFLTLMFCFHASTLFDRHKHAFKWYYLINSSIALKRMIRRSAGRDSPATHRPLRSTTASMSHQLLYTSGMKSLSTKSQRIARQVRKQAPHKGSRSSAFIASTLRHTSRQRVLASTPSVPSPPLQIDAPCFYYTKYGYCLRGSACFFNHNPELITICDAFVKGRCTTNTCPLRHETEYSRLPVCHHFLQSNCLDPNCPYPHCTHVPNAPICTEFQRGRCSLESNCRSIHSYVCAAYYASGGVACPNQAHCPYLHPANLTFAVNTTISTPTRSRMPSQVPCKYMQLFGDCARGTSCFYSHNPQLFQTPLEDPNGNVFSVIPKIETPEPSTGEALYEDVSEVETELDTSREGRDADISDVEITREHFKPKQIVSVVIKREKVFTKSEP